MIANVRYPQVAAEVASLSPWWLRTALRGELGFSGVIFSDDLSMRALASEGDMPERTRRALTAGADMALICNSPLEADATLVALRGYSDPVGQARLVSLRRRHVVGADLPAPPGELRGSDSWRLAVAALDQAQAQPGLTLS